MDVHCILIEIFNGKQVRQSFSMLTKIEVKQTIRTTHALAQTLSSRAYTLNHWNARCVNMVGARSWCSVVLMLGHCRQCRHRLGISPHLRLFLMLTDCYTLPYFSNQ